MSNTVYLIFDLGGTLVFDPFDETISRLSKVPLRETLDAGLHSDAVDEFINNWKHENDVHNFEFASHFLQEEVWITRAARVAYLNKKIRSEKCFPIWTTKVLTAYRQSALDVIASQPHLPDLRLALGLAKDRGYSLLVASNDRYFATSAMLSAAGILGYFDFVATSEGLSFFVPGAEKPSALFFEALQKELRLSFDTGKVFYIGDDESRDIQSVKQLQMKSVRFFGNLAARRLWLDNPMNTEADFSYHNYSQFFQLVKEGAFGK